MLMGINQFISPSGKITGGELENHCFFSVNHRTKWPIAPIVMVEYFNSGKSPGIFQSCFNNMDVKNFGK
jgi:hypothetical protein